MKVIEWSLDEARKMQKEIDEHNQPIWQKHQRAVKAAIEDGKDAPEGPEGLLEAAIPQFHMSGERLFEVQAKGETRQDVVTAINRYIRSNPRAPQPQPDVSADKSW